jgi:hypothetical protein
MLHLYGVFQPFAGKSITNVIRAFRTNIRIYSFFKPELSVPPVGGFEIMITYPFAATVIIGNIYTAGTGNEERNTIVRRAAIPRKEEKPKTCFGSSICAMPFVVFILADSVTVVTQNLMSRELFLSLYWITIEPPLLIPEAVVGIALALI